MGLQTTLKALGDPIRREILHLLKDGRMSAGEIVERFPVTGASISRHLSVLKEADLIRDTREGKFIFYELNASVLEEIMLWITDLKGDGECVRKEQTTGNSEFYHYTVALFGRNSVTDFPPGNNCFGMDRNRCRKLLEC